VATVYPWGDSRRFNSYIRFSRSHFGKRMQRIAINGGFTCPNRDGQCGTGGCTFCSNEAFMPAYCNPYKSITRQIDEGITFFRKPRNEQTGFLAYFQAFTGTYAPLPVLQARYEEALRHPAISGIVISTRPDCLNEALLCYLENLQQHTYVQLELGIESFQDRTLARINRGHNVDCTLDALQRIETHRIPVGGHLIFGLLGETPDQWLDELKIVNRLPLHDLKFHQLQIIRRTRLEEDFRMRPHDYHRFSVDEYIQFIAQYLSRLSPGIVIARLASEVSSACLAETPWQGIKYDTVVQGIERELERQNLWQGKCL
jgi:uncharacterized protein